jgi:hypothetical protein
MKTLKDDLTGISVLLFIAFIVVALAYAATY